MIAFNWQPREYNKSNFLNILTKSLNKSFNLDGSFCYRWVRLVFNELKVILPTDHTWNIFNAISDNELRFGAGYSGNSIIPFRTNDTQQIRDFFSTPVNYQNKKTYKNGLLFGYVSSSLHQDQATQALNNSSDKKKKGIISVLGSLKPINHVGIVYNGEFYNLISNSKTGTKVINTSFTNFTPVAYWPIIDEIVASFTS